MSPELCQVMVYPVPPQVLPAEVARVAWICGGLVKLLPEAVNLPVMPSWPT